MESASDTIDLLRPNQVAEMNEEIKNLEGMLNAPPHIRSQITDRGMMSKRLGRLRHDAETLTPRAYAPEDRDAAVREFEALADTIRTDMPSSEEMRRNPPGAVGKQIAWQKRCAKQVQRYKHIALRLLAGGDVPKRLNHAGDVANIEMLRPLKTDRDLDMKGAQIPKTVDIHIGADPANSVVFSDEETAALEKLSPLLAGQLALLDNTARAGIKVMLTAAMALEAPALDPNAKPTFKSLGYNGMKKLAAANGIKVFGMNNAALIAALRAKNLIE